MKIFPVKYVVMLELIEFKIEKVEIVSNLKTLYPSHIKTKIKIVG